MSLRVGDNVSVEDRSGAWYVWHLSRRLVFVASQRGGPTWTIVDGRMKTDALIVPRRVVSRIQDGRGRYYSTRCTLTLVKGRLP